MPTDVSTTITEGPARLDTTGRLHRVRSAPCEECGCSYDYSIDEPGMLWEAGPAIEDGCLDPVCECHVIPVIGLPFHLNVAS